MASKKPISEKTRALYERVVKTSAAAAQDEKLPLALRQWYAGIALHFDNRLTNMKTPDTLGEV